MGVSSEFIWNPVYKKFTGKNIFMPFPLLHFIRSGVNSMNNGIFMDYTGTMVREDGEYTQQLVDTYLKHSSIKDPNTAVATVWRLIKEYENKSYLEDFITEDEIVDDIIKVSRQMYGLSCDFEKLHETWRLSWVYAPLFDDVKPFFDTCPVPIYVITNDGLSYIERSMEDKGLHPAGIVSAEAVRAYKPHREIFDEALRVSGLKAEEVLHVGDSVISDVKGALTAGIRPVLLDRTGKQTCSEAAVIRSMGELLALI